MIPRAQLQCRESIAGSVNRAVSARRKPRARRDSLYVFVRILTSHHVVNDEANVQ